MGRGRSRRLLALVGWGLFLGLLVVAWRDPALLQRARHAARLGAEAVPGCQLAAGQPCTATFGDGLAVTLSAEPAPLRAGTPSRWLVEVAGPGVAAHSLEITGVSMPMGVTTLPLSPGDGGRWEAHGALPLCTASRMLWRADVLLEAGGRRRVAGFQFWTGQGSDDGAAAAAAPPGRGAAAPGAPAPTFGDFTVQTAEGPLSLSQLRGQLVLLYFGYTACPDICPTTLSTLGAALRLLPEDQQARVTGLMVSLDPGRDGLPRLQTYASHFHPRFHGGTVPDEQLDALTADWDIAWRLAPLEGSALGYAVDHPTHSLLLGPDGDVLDRIPHGTDPEEVARRIATALASAPPHG